MRRSFTVALCIAVATMATSIHAPAAEPRLEAAIRKKAAEILLDPFSAVFTFDIVTPVNDIGGKVCGTVNAKNRLGAYTGQKFFLAGYVKSGKHYRAIHFQVEDFTLEQALTRPKICY